MTFPGLVIYRFDAPLFFANAARFRDDIVGAVDQADPPITDVLFDGESMCDIDSTGAHTLLELLDTLDDLQIGLFMARIRTELRDEFILGAHRDRLAPPYSTCSARGYLAQSSGDGKAEVDVTESHFPERLLPCQTH